MGKVRRYIGNYTDLVKGSSSQVGQGETRLDSAEPGPDGVLPLSLRITHRWRPELFRRGHPWDGEHLFLILSRFIDQGRFFLASCCCSDRCWCSHRAFKHYCSGHFVNGALEKRSVVDGQIKGDDDPMKKARWRIQRSVSSSLEPIELDVISAGSFPRAGRQRLG